MIWSDPDSIKSAEERAAEAHAQHQRYIAAALRSVAGRPGLKVSFGSGVASLNDNLPSIPLKPISGDWTSAAGLLTVWRSGYAAMILGSTPSLPRPNRGLAPSSIISSGRVVRHSGFVTCQESPQTWRPHSPRASGPRLSAHISRRRFRLQKLFPCLRWALSWGAEPTDAGHRGDGDVASLCPDAVWGRARDPTPNTHRPGCVRGSCARYCISRSSVRWSWIRVSLRDQLPPDQIPRPVRFKTKTRRRSVSALPRH